MLMDTLLTPKQVAQRLAVSPRTVYLWIEEGRLPALHLSERVTRISEETLAAFVHAASGGAQSAAEPLGAYGAVGGTGLAGPAAAVDPTGRLRGLLLEHRAEILALAEEAHMENVRVFGSVARGDAEPDSDIDILVDPLPRASLLGLAGFGLALESLLDVSVDVVPARSLKPLIRDRVLAEAVPL
ncbi:MAG: hypothetical protein CVT60_06765 [Actinobacteria bacterium HGW-Actinobacteria-10]|nr:MAG: hypothetical protein CVT60_06765 [Actinobacteria bacterium HGW-Actinobacteria-10]